VTRLLAAAYALAREVTSDPRDRVFCVETVDQRVVFDRRVACAAVVDGRPEKPGVLLVAVTTDGADQQLGVSSLEQAETILRALRLAWPELGKEVAS